MPTNDTLPEGSSLLDKIKRGRKTSAFLVSSGATFALLCVFWALSVQGFVAYTTVRLAITDPAVSAASVENHIEEFWSAQTSDTGLSASVRQVSQTKSVDNPAVIGRNFERLRDKLGYRIDHDARNGHVDIKLVLEGSRDEADAALVQALADNIAARFAALPTMNENGRSSREELLAVRTRGLQAVDRMELLVQQIELGLDDARETLSVSRAVPATPVSSGNELEALYANLDQLLGEKDALLVDGVPGADSRVIDVQNRIEAVRGRIDELRKSLPRSETPFIMAAHRNGTSAVDVDGLDATLDSIDTASLKDSLGQLKMDFTGEDPGERAFVNPPYFVKGVSTAQLIPSSGLPEPGRVLLFMMISGLIGGVMAWAYEPLKDDVGFSSSQEVGEALRLPVLSALKRKSDQRTTEPVMTPVPNLIFQLARFCLLVIVMTVAVAMLVSPTIRAAFLDNPFNGLARIIWLLSGR